MLAAAKMRRTSLVFRAPVRVLREIRRDYAPYIVDDEESVNIAETEWYADMDRQMKAGDYVRAVREGQGLTLRELGEKVGASPQRVHDWETGQRGISKKSARKLSVLLKLPIERLV